MNRWRLTRFLVVVLTIWAALHLYVFWRLASVPWIAAHLSRGALLVLGIALWSSYPLGRILDAWKFDRLAWPLEWLGANWIGCLFLLFVTLLCTELLTAGGWLLPSLAPLLRGWAVVIAAGLALVALVQGNRSPVLSEYEVRLAGLAPERDGLVLVAASDLHLGPLLGARWMTAQVARVMAVKPDLVVIIGDLVDGNVARMKALEPVLRQLRAPLGVWAVTGNHEFYAGLERSLETFRAAGYSVLRDEWAEAAPGLIVAGVDDLTARGQFGLRDEALEHALARRPAGGTVLLSHTPWQTEQAAAAGVGLMLCGHTHAGQVWPFGYLVRLRYPRFAGCYRHLQMTTIVCRGTGTWGPRMRLWHPAEILRITLRAASGPTNKTKSL